MITADFALYNVDHLVTVAPGSHPAIEGSLGILHRAALAARDGRIVWVGTMDEMQDAVILTPNATVLNTHGSTVLPGFVDPHTHPVFAGDRVSDFYARTLGAGYAEQMEGGIMRTVKATRQRDEDQLLDLAYARADTFIRYGTTTIGARTGYGLTLRDEEKSLQVLNRLQRLHMLKIVPGFLGAHLVPSDFEGDANAYVQQLIDEWLPAAQGHAAFVDVWCDEGGFTPDQCRRIMRRAREMGFELTAHANELGPYPGVQLAVEMGARSVDHDVYLSDEDIAALAGSNTVAVLLPGTSFYLNSDHYAPARRLLDAGARVALGTDFNPGSSNTQNMQFILTLAVMKLKMTPEEAIRAATREAAEALAMEDVVGSLEVGKFCDFAVYRVDDYRSIPATYAMNGADVVVASGQIVYRDGLNVPARGALVSLT